MEITNDHNLILQLNLGLAKGGHTLTTLTRQSTQNLSRFKQFDALEFDLIEEENGVFFHVAE